MGLSWSQQRATLVLCQHYIDESSFKNKPSNNMDELHEARLSVVPIAEGHVILVQDRKSRFLSALSASDGTILAKYRAKKDYINENYQRLVCQLNPSTFVFANTQYYGSWKNDIRMPDHSAFALDFASKQRKNFFSFAVLEMKVVCMADALMLVNTKAYPMRTWRVILFDPTLTFKEYAFSEPENLKDHFVVYLSPSNKNNEPRLMYFAPPQEGRQICIDKVAEMRLNGSTTNITVQSIVLYRTCYPDIIHGLPSAKLLDSIGLNLFCQQDNKLCLADLETSEDSNELACCGLWILNLDSDEYKWEYIELHETKTVSKDCCMFVSDQNVVCVVDCQNNNNLRLVHLCRLGISTLKQISAGHVIGIDPQVVKKSARIQVQCGLPEGCVPSLPWLENLYEEQQFDNKDARSLIFVNLSKEHFETFCEQCLNISSIALTELSIESFSIQSSRRFTATFKNVAEKSKFLEIAKSQESDRYTSTIVEIYDMATSYIDNNSDPIFIPITADITL